MNLLTTTTTYTKSDREITVNGKQANVRVLKSKEIKNSDLRTYTEEYFYPFETTTGTNAALYQKMTDKHLLSDYVKTYSYFRPANGGVYSQQELISAEYRDFAEFGTVANKFYKPQRIDYLKQHSSATTSNYSSYLAPKMSYKYDNYGNIITATDLESEFSTCYLWGYNNQYQIAKIENATYDELMNALSPSSQGFFNHILNNMNGLTLTDPMFISFCDILRNALPNTLVTIYMHKPLVGLTSITNPRGITTYFEYDEFGRLKNTKDSDLKLLEEYEYQYKDNYVAKAPDITAAVVNGSNVTVTYEGCSSLINAVNTSYRPYPSGSTISSSTSGCYGTVTVTVPVSNRTYQITIKLYYKNGQTVESYVNVFVP